jgi:hypothetical protein
MKLELGKTTRPGFVKMMMTKMVVMIMIIMKVIRWK